MLYGKYEVISKLSYGWSDDQKYVVCDMKEDRYLLRRGSLSRKKQAYEEFRLIQRSYEIGLPVQEPIAVYENIDEHILDRIYQWIDGAMLEDVLANLDQHRQFELGMTAGSILKSIHALNYEGVDLDWGTYYRERVYKKLNAYLHCGIKLKQEDLFLSWIREFDCLLNSRPLVHQHGDYHPGNMILSEKEVLYIIDFDRHSIGDPWEEFNRIVWSAKKSSYFASGQIKAYFEDEIPEDFFRLLKYYFAVNALGSVPWAIKFGQKEIDVMIEQAQTILSWYPDPSQITPNWFIFSIESD